MLYESDKDRRAEVRVAKALERYGIDPMLTPKTWPWDITVYYDNRITSLIEVKQRSRLHNTIVVDKLKIDKLMACAALLGAKPRFIVVLEYGGIYVWPCRRGCPVRWFKREKPRNIKGEGVDTHDLVYDVPIGEFASLDSVMEATKWAIKTEFPKTSTK